MKEKKEVTPEQVWASMAELASSQKETDQQQKETKAIIQDLAKSQKETDRQLKETAQQQKEAAQQQKETKALIQDLVKSQKETDRHIEDVAKRQKETDQQQKEATQQQKETKALIQDLAKSQKETDRQLKKTDRRFNSQWGKLIESLVRGDLVKLFSQRDMSVQGTSQRIEKTYNKKQYEFDILVHNGEDLIVVEVKTTLKVKDVKRFLDKLKDFKKMFHEYREKKIYGAVAYLGADENSKTYAQNKKLFVIRATGSSSSIINPMDFKPRIF